MKILIVNTYDIKGGAARAAFRLCEGLIAAGHEVKMLVQTKSGDAGFVNNPTIFCIIIRSINLGAIMIF